ncbi:MAG: hypothetical protein HKM06_01625 [Spirochaetales bacterium]|nr:hypothetical protein [Spirochaetales bacterium]
MTNRTKIGALRLGTVWPFLVLAFLAILFIVILFFSRKSPVITSLSPSMASPGQTIVLTGEYFGRTPQDGTLTLAGGEILPSSIVSWSDKRIEFTVPPDAVSGLLTMSNSQGVSKGILFTNKKLIPLISKPLPGRSPILEASFPQPAPDLLGLRVDGLPEHSSGSYLDLTPDSGVALRVTHFLRWDRRDVVFRLPVGYGSGTTLVVHTAFGNSEPFVLGNLPALELNDPRTRDLHFQVDASVSSGMGNLLLWVALPESDLTGQPLKWLDSNQEALPGSQGELRPFLWENLVGGSQTLSFSVRVTAYHLHWDGVVPAGNANFTPAVQSLGFGSDWDAVRKAASSLSTSRDPVVLAKAAYLAVLKHLSASSTSKGLEEKPRTPSVVWNSAKASDLEFALMYASLVRSLGLNARLVAGFLAKHKTALPHVWDEVWIPAVGWIPVDPQLGKLASDPMEDFGNQGNDHIIWSLGDPGQEKLEPRSHWVNGIIPFSFQNHLAETTGSLKIDGPVWQSVSVVSN